MINKNNRINKSPYITMFLVLLLSPALALAYVGPGSGLSAIGALFAVLGTMLFAVVGFIWYPVKRLIQFIRRKCSKDSESS